MSAHRIETTLNQDGKLVLEDLPFLEEYEPSGLGVSIISCWEVAKLVEYYPHVKTLK